MSKAFKSVGKVAKTVVNPLSTVSSGAGGMLNPLGSVGSLVGSAVGVKSGGGLSSLLGESDAQKITGLSGQLSADAQRAARGRDIAAGRDFAKSVLPEGSLGRLGEQADVKASLDVLRGQLGGFSAPELQAQRDVMGQGIARQTQMAGRRLAAAQARAGVRGATAAAQQGNIAAQGIQAGTNLERDLFLANRAEQARAAQDLLQRSGAVSKFDMSQAARERFAELSTGLGFAQIGSAERAGVTAGNAAVQAAQAQAPSGGLLGGVLGK